MKWVGSNALHALSLAFSLSKSINPIGTNDFFYCIIIALEGVM